MDQEMRVLNLVSLAKKAGRVVSGEFSVSKAVRGGKAHFVIISLDASDNTKKKFKNMCEWYHVPVICLADMERLGHSVGCQNRSSLAVLDPGFAGAILKALGMAPSKSGGSEWQK